MKASTLISFLFLTGILVSLSSMPLSPESIEQLKASGQLEQVVERYNKRFERGVDVPGPNLFKSMRRMRRDNADQTTFRVLVILVDFSDNVADQDNYPTEHYEELLFSLGVLNPGSMREWYRENSYDEVNIIGEAIGWYRMPQTYAYYVDHQNGVGSYPYNSQGMTEDAVNAADGDVDYSLYDNDQDGWCDPIFVVHAGPGAENHGGDPDMIWSHSWAMNNHRFIADGVWIYRYTTEPEDGGVGVFGHELGHALFGLPDVYDRDYTSEGLGWWSMMAGGSHNGGGNSPAHFDVWCKLAAGFISPTVLEYDANNVQIQPMENQDDCYLLWTRGSYSDEYFLIENRQRVSFDAALPSSGLMIYHVDNAMSGTQNDNEWYPGHEDQGHYLVALEQADGDWGLERGWNRGDTGDPYPGNENNLTFGYNSTPDSRDYSGTWTGVAVRNISINGGVVTCDLQVGSAQVSIQHVNYNMVGIPVIVPNGDAATLFQDDFNNLDPGFPYWRICRWDVINQRYIRYSELEQGGIDLGNPADFAPGLGFWVAHNTRINCVLDIGNGQLTDEVSYTERHAVSINKPNGDDRGLTQLANPFHYTYDWRDTYVTDGTQTITINSAASQNWICGYCIAWDSGTQEYKTVNFHPDSTSNYNVAKWQGFWVEQLDADRNIDILFTPDGYGAGGMPRRPDGDPGQDDAEGWALQLSVIEAGGGYRDEDNIIGINSCAGDGYDFLDAAEFEPMSSNYVHLYFKHPDWQTLAEEYTYDYRSTEFHGRKVWDFSIVINNLPDREFILSWRDVNRINDEYSFLLMDTDNHRDISNLRNSNEFRFHSRQSDREERHFRLYVSKPGSVVEVQEYELITAFPNPFNDRLNISINLPSSQNISIRVHDPQGREVAILNQGIQTAGLHHFTWNTDSFGSGLYFIRLETPQRVVTEKAVLLR